MPGQGAAIRACNADVSSAPLSCASENRPSVRRLALLLHLSSRCWRGCPGIGSKRRTPGPTAHRAGLDTHSATGDALRSPSTAARDAALEPRPSAAAGEALRFSARRLAAATAHRARTKLRTNPIALKALHPSSRALAGHARHPSPTVASEAAAADGRKRGRGHGSDEGHYEKQNRHGERRNTRIVHLRSPRS